MVTIAGKADSTLVAMAAKAEIADKPMDTSIESAAMLETYGQFMQGLGTIYDNEMAKLEAEKKPLEDIYGKVITEVTNGTYTDTEITKVQEYINQLREDFKAIPRGKKGEAQRQALQARINKFYNGYDASSAENLTFATLIDGGEYSDVTMGGYLKNIDRHITSAEASEIFRHLAAGEGTGYNLNFVNDSKSYDIKMDSGETITVRQEDLSKIFGYQNIEAETSMDQLGAGYAELGASEGTEFDINEASGFIRKRVFTDDKAFEFIVKRQQLGNEMSYYEALHKEESFMTADMFKTINDLSPSLKSKYGGGDDLDAEDFTGVDDKNYKELVRAITDPSDPNFNRKLAYKLAADWHTGALDQKFKDGEKMRNKNNNNNNNPTTFPWGNSIGTSRPVEHIIDWWNGDKSENELKLGKDKVMWDPDEERWYFFDASAKNGQGGRVLIDSGEGDGVDLDYLIQSLGNNSTQFKDKYQQFDSEIDFNAQSFAFDGKKDTESKDSGEGKTKKKKTDRPSIYTQFKNIFLGQGDFEKMGNKGRRRAIDKLVNSYDLDPAKKIQVITGKDILRSGIAPGKNIYVLFVQPNGERKQVKYSFDQQGLKDFADFLSNSIKTTQVEDKSDDKPKDVGMPGAF